jgi:hypothetical protein
MMPVVAATFSVGVPPCPPAAIVNDRLRQRTTTADVVEHPQVFDHVGLLVNEPPGYSGLFFRQSIDHLNTLFERNGMSFKSPPPPE